MTACNVYLNVCCLHVMTDGICFFTEADYLESFDVAVHPQIEDAILASYVR
jgi:hypothetical protein